MDGACAAATDALPHLASLRRRCDLLQALASALVAHADEIVALAIQETALAETRLRGELERTALQLNSFARAAEDGDVFEAIIETRDQLARPTPRPDLRRVLVPVGPVAVFAASNFPLAFSVLGGDTASALAAGCPVIVKAHPGHPRLSALVGSLAEGVTGSRIVQVVYGMKVGLELVGHPVIRAVGFTGSEAGAQAVQARIAMRPDPIPFYGELGSINPVVVTKAAADADGAAIMRALAASYTQSAGQLCTKPGLVFIPSGRGLRDVLAAAVSKVPPEPMLTSDIAARFKTQVAALSQHPDVQAIMPPAIAGGTEVAACAFSVHASRVPDAVLEECFGPVTILVEYDDLSDVLAVLARLTGSLTTTVHRGPTEGAAELRVLVDRLINLSGRVIFGGWPTGVAVAPAMQHGGPWPAATTPLHTSVGVTAARRFLRPACFQEAPDEILPPELKDANPLSIGRYVDGVHTRARIQRATSPSTAGT